MIISLMSAFGWSGEEEEAGSEDAELEQDDGDDDSHGGAHQLTILVKCEMMRSIRQKRFQMCENYICIT